MSVAIESRRSGLPFPSFDAVPSEYRACWHQLAFELEQLHLRELRRERTRQQQETVRYEPILDEQVVRTIARSEFKRILREGLS